MRPQVQFLLLVILDRNWGTCKRIFAQFQVLAGLSKEAVKAIKKYSSTGRKILLVI